MNNTQVRLHPKPSDEAIIVELLRHRGRLAATAQALGVRSTYVRKRIIENEEVNEAYVHSRDQVIDAAEDTVYRAIEKGNITAATYVLSRLGKDRGYADHIEITGKDGQPIEVTLNLGNRPINSGEIDDSDDFDELATETIEVTEDVSLPPTG